MSKVFALAPTLGTGRKVVLWEDVFNAGVTLPKQVCLLEYRISI